MLLYMPGNDVMIFKGRGVRKELVLQLSDGEDLFACIRQAMAEGKIERSEVAAIEGRIKEGNVNYFQGNKYKSLEIKDANVYKASGKYEMRGRDLFGKISVIINQNGRMNTVTLGKGTASEGLKIRLSFIEVHEVKP